MAEIISPLKENTLYNPPIKIKPPTILPKGITLPQAKGTTTNVDALGLFRQLGTKLNVPSVGTGVETNVPLAEGKKMPVPEGYKFEGGQTVSPQAFFASLPAYIGGGQYTVEPTEPEKLLKSVRTYDSAENKFLRGGLSSTYYELDHIIPIWLGGSDIPSNKQLLFYTDHNKKTLVDAVARTLYTADKANKININEAKNMVINWRDKDTSKLSEDQLDPKSFLLPIDTALTIKKEWDKPPTIGTPWGITKDVLGKLGEIVTLGKYKREPTTIYGETLFKPETQKIGVAGEFARALSSGLTGGWIPGGAAEYTGTEKGAVTAARLAGNIVGSLAGFAGLTKVAGALARVTRVGSLAVKSTTIQKLASHSTYLDGKFPVSMGKLASIVKNIGIFNAYGQLSKQEENTFSERVKRIFEDTALATVLGVSAKGLKGLPMASGGAFTISYLSGDSLQDSFINAGIIGGLHGLGSLEQRKIDLNAHMDQVANRTEIYNFRKKFLGGKEPNVNKPTREELRKEDEIIYENIIKDSPNDLEAFRALKENQVASRQLYKGGLTKEMSLKEEIKDFFSLRKILDKPKSYTVSETPKALLDLAEEYPEFFTKDAKIEFKPKEPVVLDPLTTPEGKIQITGTSEGSSPKTAADIKELIKLRDEGKVDDVVILVKDPKINQFLRMKNLLMNRKDIEVGVAKKYDNPDKVVGMWKWWNNKFHFLGYAPRDFTIEGKKMMVGEKTEDISYNAKIKKWNQQHPEQTPIQEYNPNFNDVAISDAMDANKTNHLFGTIDFAGLGKESGEPALTVKLTKQNWNDTLSTKTKYTLKQEQTKNIIEAIKDEKMPEKSDASDYVDVLPIDPSLPVVLKEGYSVSRKVFNDALKMFEEDLKKGDAKKLAEDVNTMLKKEMLTEEDAVKLISKRDSLKLVDFVDLISKSKNVNKLTMSLSDLSKDQNFAYGYDLIKDKPLIYGEKMKPEEVKVEMPKPVPKVVVPKERIQTTVQEAIKKVVEQKGVLPPKETISKKKVTPQEKMKQFKEKVEIPAKVVPKEVTPAGFTKPEVSPITEQTPVGKEENVSKPQESSDLNTTLENKKRIIDNYKSVSNYGETGKNVLFDHLLTDAKTKAIKDNKLELVDKITKAGENIDRKSMMDVVKRYYKKYDKDIAKAYPAFVDDIEKEFSEFRIKSPFNDSDFYQEFKRHFINLSQNKPAFKSAVSNNLIPIEAGVEAINNFEKNINNLKKRLKLKDTDLSVSTLDDTENIGFGAVKSLGRVIGKAEDLNFIVIGPPTNDLGSNILVKFHPKLVEMYDTNPKEYAFKGTEILPKTTTKQMDTKTYDFRMSQDIQYEKAFRVIMKEGYGLNLKNSDKISKRLSLLNDRDSEAILPPEIEIKVSIFTGHTLKETGIDVRKNAPKYLSEEDLIKKEERYIENGGAFITPDLIRLMFDSNGFIKDYKHMKLVINDLTPELYNFLFKGNYCELDEYHRDIFENQYGHQISKYEILGFTDNSKGDLPAKVGKDIRGKDKWEMYVKGESIRVKYDPEPHNKVTLPLNLMSKIAKKLAKTLGYNTLEDDLTKVYEKPLLKYKTLVDDLYVKKIGFVDAFKNYGIKDPLELVPPQYKEQVKLGANTITMSKWIDDTLRSTWQNDVVRLQGTIKGNRLKIVPFMEGRYKELNNLMNHSNETYVILSDEVINELGKKEGDYILVNRQPNLMLQTAVRAKIISGDKYGMTSLGREQAIVSAQTMYDKLGGDADGDDLYVFPLGHKEDEIPESLGNFIEEIRGREGDPMSIELTKYDEKPLTYDNMIDKALYRMNGTDATNDTYSKVRLLSTLNDLDVHFKLTPTSIETYIKGKLKERNYLRTGIKNDVTLNFRNDIDTKFFANNISAMSVDASSAKNLKDIGYSLDSNFITRRLFEIKGDKSDVDLLADKEKDVWIIKPENKKIIFSANALMKEFQTLFTLANRDRYKGTPAEMSREIKKYNKMLNYIDEKDLPIVPRLMKNMEFAEVEITDADKILRDKKAVENLKENFAPSKDKKLSDEGRKFINFLKDKFYAFNTDFSPEKAKMVDTEAKKLGKDLGDIKKELRKSVEDYWNKNLTKFTEQDKELIGYHLLTGYNHINRDITIFNSKYPHYKFNEITAVANPKLMTEYYKVFEKIEPSKEGVPPPIPSAPVVTKQPTTKLPTPEEQEQIKKIRTIINKELPKEAAESVTIIANEKDIPSNAYYSVKSNLATKGITDPLSIRWATENEKKVDIYGAKSESELQKRAEEQFIKKQDKTQYPNLKESSELDKNFDSWTEALKEDYPVYFKDMIMDVPREGLIDKTRINKFVTPVSKVALRSTYDYVQQHPKETPNISKLYRERLIKETTEAVAHEPSASGKGHWIHIPRTKPGELIDTQWRDANPEGHNYAPAPAWHKQSIDQTNQFKINVEMLKRLSPETWCTKTWAAGDYVKNYDNYLLVVDGKTVAGIEVEPPIQEVVSRTNQTPTGRTLIVSGVHEVTSIYNNGVAPIEHLDDVLAFLKKHEISDIDKKRSITRAKRYKVQGKTDKDVLRIEGGEIPGHDLANIRPEDWTAEMALEEVTNDGFALRFVPRTLQNHRIVSIAVRQYGYALEYASSELQNNKEVVLEAVKQNGHALEYASSELQNNKEVVLEAVKQDGYVLKYASPELQNNKEVVLETVKQDGYAIKYASPELQNNKEVVLEAVRQNGYALEYASPELKNNKEVVLETVRQYGYALKYASPELQNNKEVVLEAVRQNGYALESASPELKNNKEVVLEAVKQDGYALKSASPELQNNKEVVLETVKQNGFAIKYASPELQNNPEVKDMKRKYIGKMTKEEDILYSKIHNGVIQGYYDPSTDKAVLVSKNLKPEEASQIALHEITHRGMIRTAIELGGLPELHKVLTSAKTELMKAAPDLLKRTGHSSIDELIMDYGFDPKTIEGEAKLLSELTARWAERLAGRPQPSWWIKLLEDIRIWVTKFMGKTLNEKEVDQMVSGFIKIGTITPETTRGPPAQYATQYSKLMKGISESKRPITKYTGIMNGIKK